MTTKVRRRKQSLSLEEQETIINFNKGESIAYVFTYEKTWQKHLEQRLGLKPVMDNGYGGKEYQIDKRLIPMPRTKRQYSPEERKRKAARLASIRSPQKPLL